VREWPSVLKLKTNKQNKNNNKQTRMEVSKPIFSLETGVSVKTKKIIQNLLIGTTVSRQ
jgi:hypothetical protein